MAAEEIRDITVVVQAKPSKTWRACVWDTLDKSPGRKTVPVQTRRCFAHDRWPQLLHQIPGSSQYQQRLRLGDAGGPGLLGNELNYMQTCWTVGYVIGEIPAYHSELLSAACQEERLDL